MQTRDAFNLQSVRANAADARAKAVQHVTQILHVWLAGSVIDDRTPAREHRRQQCVLRGHHARFLQQDFRAG